MKQPVFSIDVDLVRGTFWNTVRVESTHRVIALVGASGTGKTSVLHAIAGLVRPTRGRIVIGGRCLFDSAIGIDEPAHLRRIGYVFQDGRLFPHLDVRANLLYGAPRRASGDARFSLEGIVDLLGIAPLLARRIDGLSGGELQRVAIGRALLSAPELLLLDEPLSMLDRKRKDELLPWLQRLRDEVALPMVYVSHSPEETARLADAVYRVD
ncbi:molybdate-transporting ATPase [Lysobacter helvus]|uniref:Molybdate-transporting ATPase n=2 Tax=Lysobacteraceae TaxID=32033 RepID=A0ABN6FVX1_9GAMM|nr:MULTISPECIES: ATP-binding cassette domain-containing protein [Lysobacter]BCT92721.1 molybdate-transporting ATPase [Lysobacter caseinilyticus]BCT95874.1 molybdate-transporting ATPase [Lysobacter helvus]